jgi:hypothetical protein
MSQLHWHAGPGARDLGLTRLQGKLQTDRVLQQLRRDVRAAVLALDDQLCVATFCIENM